MPANRTITAAITFLIVLATVRVARPQTPSSCYSNPPVALSEKVKQATRSILQRGNGLAINSIMPDLVFFTIGDVVAKKEIASLTVYQYYGDVMRTDQQTGASSTSSGSTSAVEKPGLLQLLGFAVERGAIQQSISDSTVTLTTSPYALVAAVEGDSPDTYKAYPLLTRLGVSATFILKDPADVSSSFSRKQLTEWSAKLRLTGDRSTRSAAFQDLWNKKLRDLEQARLDIFGVVESKIYNIPAISDSFLADAAAGDRTPTGDPDVLKPLRQKIDDYLTANNLKIDDINKTQDETKVSEAQHKAIEEMIFCVLFDKVHEPVKNGTIKVDEAAVVSALNRLSTVQQALNKAREEFKEDLKNLEKSGTLSTLAYTNHRVAQGSDYSEFKLLFERHVSPFEAVLNASFSIYNKPDPAKNQDRLRDFSISGSLEWASKRNSLFRGDPELATPITFSVNGRYERLMENENMAMREPDIASFQARLEIPVAPGFSIPIAYTYASATEMMPKRENRFNVGVHLDVNKILSFKKATKGQ